MEPLSIVLLEFAFVIVWKYDNFGELASQTPSQIPISWRKVVNVREPEMCKLQFIAWKVPFSRSPSGVSSVILSCGVLCVCRSCSSVFKYIASWGSTTAKQAFPPSSLWTTIINSSLQNRVTLSIWPYFFRPLYCEFSVFLNERTYSCFSSVSEEERLPLGRSRSHAERKIHIYTSPCDIF